MLGVTCKFLFDKVVGLVGGGSVNNGAYLVLFTFGLTQFYQDHKRVCEKGWS